MNVIANSIVEDGDARVGAVNSLVALSQYAIELREEDYPTPAVKRRKGLV